MYCKIFNKGKGLPLLLLVKNMPANERDLGSIPEPGAYPGGGNGNPVQYFCLENPMDRRAWQVWSTRSQRVRHIEAT